MAEIPLEKIQILNNGPVSPDKGLPIEKKNLFLANNNILPTLLNVTNFLIKKLFVRKKSTQIKI